MSPHDPLKAFFYSGTGVAHYYAGRYGEAVEWAQNAIRERPRFHGGAPHPLRQSGAGGPNRGDPRGGGPAARAPAQRLHRLVRAACALNRARDAAIPRRHAQGRARIGALPSKEVLRFRGDCFRSWTHKPSWVGGGTPMSASEPTPVANRLIWARRPVGRTGHPSPMHGEDILHLHSFAELAMILNRGSISIDDHVSDG